MCRMYTGYPSIHNSNEDAVHRNRTYRTLLVLRNLQYWYTGMLLRSQVTEFTRLQNPLALEKHLWHQSGTR